MSTWWTPELLKRPEASVISGHDRCVAGRGQSERWRFLEVFGLCGLAFAQPFYAVFGASPEVFVFTHATNRDIVLFSLVLAFVPPLVLWGAGALLAIAWPKAREPFHVFTLAVLAALLAMYLVKHQGARLGLALIAVGLVGGVVLAIAYRRIPLTATLLHYLAFGPVIFLAGFLVFSPTGELMRPSGAEPASLDLAAPRRRTYHRW